MIKEAELIVSNYIKDSRKQEIFNGSNDSKKVNPIKNTPVNMVINMVLVCSIALLIYILSRMI